MEEDHRRAVALVEVRQAQPVDLAVARARRESPGSPSSASSGVRTASVISSRSIPRASSARLAPDAHRALQLAPVLAAEKSKVPFYIAGGLLVAWALLLSMGIGMRRSDFPANAGQQRAVMAVTAVLVLAAVVDGRRHLRRRARAARRPPRPAPHRRRPTSAKHRQRRGEHARRTSTQPTATTGTPAARLLAGAAQLALKLAAEPRASSATTPSS